MTALTSRRCPKCGEHTQHHPDCPLDAIRRTQQAMIACQAIIREHEDDEDRAHVDHKCGDCNMGAGPHLRLCAYHAAKEALS